MRRILSILCVLTLIAERMNRCPRRGSGILAAGEVLGKTVPIR